MHFWPILRSVPIFGRGVADDWLWALNLSPGFFGQGIVTGLAISLHMFVGTLVGWVILAPLAKRKGWAPDPIDDWESGGRAWIIWISLSGLLADAIVNLIWLSVRPFWAAVCKQRAGISRSRSISDSHAWQPGNLSPKTPLLNHSPQSRCNSRVAPSISSIPGIGFIISTIICILAVCIIFRHLF